jgi:hypothetical protein
LPISALGKRVKQLWYHFGHDRHLVGSAGKTASAKYRHAQISTGSMLYHFFTGFRLE